MSYGFASMVLPFMHTKPDGNIECKKLMTETIFSKVVEGVNYIC